MKLLHKSIVILLFGGLSACLEPFNPRIPDGETNLLVVEGRITNQPGPYTVRISKSAALNAENSFVTEIVNISIEEEDGIIETLIETSPGVYQTILLQGKADKRYRLTFDYLGESYQSTWEKINTPSIIDDISFEVETRETTGNDLEGAQFYIDSHGEKDGSKYLRYELEETWKIGVSHSSFFDYIGNDNIEVTKNPRHLCWTTGKQPGINLATTEGLSENILSGHLLKFITGANERFTKRYSLLVKQYTLSEEEYLFWKVLQESNEELGNLFDKQPAKVIGNITNISEPKNTVLGYFSASGLHEKRIYINTTDVPPTLVTPREDCRLDSLFKLRLGSKYEGRLFSKLETDFFIGFFFSDDGSALAGALTAPPMCSDCTFKGGQLNKPEFWEE